MAGDERLKARGDIADDTKVRGVPVQACEYTPGKWALVVCTDGKPLEVTDMGAVGAAGTPTIYNVSALVSGTEYSQALSAGTKKFLIRARGRAELQFSFVSGESGTKYITIPAGASFQEEGLNLTSKTVYFQLNKASQVVEILEWV